MQETSEVKYKCWQTTYQGIYPDQKLDNYDFKVQEQKFKEKLENPQVKLFVATKENEIIGYMCVGSPINQYKDFAKELILLYVLKEYQHLGIGKLLFNHAKQIIKDSGHSKFLINCNKYNKNAIGFYLKMGGKIVHTDADNQNKSLTQVKFSYQI